MTQRPFDPNERTQVESEEAFGTAATIIREEVQTSDQRAEDTQASTDPSVPSIPADLLAVPSDIGTDVTAINSKSTPPAPYVRPANGPMLEAGLIISDQFEVMRMIGEGGMGEVYLARDLELGRRVAIKVLKVTGDRSDTARQQLFQRDAAATARMQHPNIVTLFQRGTWQEHPFMVLELLHGEGLDTRLSRGVLSPLEAVQVVKQIAQALRHAHTMGVVHRDLKPGNVFMQEDGLIKVLDFGIALLNVDRDALREAFQRDPEQLVGTTPSTAGSPAYMAPEQWLEGGVQDQRVDLWALGVMFFEMLTSQRPLRWFDVTVSDVDIPLLRSVDAGLPIRLEQLIQRMLVRAPEARLASADALLEELDTIEHALTQTPLGGEPYRYLEPFTERDAGWFFGREREVARLQAMLNVHALLAIVGPSGAGKSSLVLAGLLPQLRRRGETWTVLTLRPGRAPLQQLHKRLHETCHKDVKLMLSDDPNEFLKRPGLAGQVLRAQAQITQGSVLVVVDQFEETFTLGTDPDARHAFATGLVAAADDPQAGVRVVLTLREDFLSKLTDTPALSEEIEGRLLLLGRPDHASMVQAICGPAERLGFEFEQGLVEDMLEELASEAAPLPMLQFAASRLWEYRDTTAHIVPHHVLTSMGGVAGILASHADDVIQQLTTTEDVETAQLLLCALVTSEGTRRHLARSELLALASDSARATRVLRHLERGRLITSTRSDEGDGVEIAHESLIAHWHMLHDWLNETQVVRRVHERIRQASGHWTERGRPAELLWQGKLLTETQTWMPSLAPRLSEQERLFLDTSSAAESRRRRWRTGMIAGAFMLALIITTSALVLMGRAQQARNDASREMNRALLAEEQARSEETRAHRAEEASDEARARAEQLVYYMLNDLHSTLEPAGRLDLLKGVVKAIDQYYASTTDEGDPDLEATHRRILALMHLAEILAYQLNIESAVATLQRSLVMAESLRRLQPDNPRWQQTTAYGWWLASQGLVRLGRHIPASITLTHAINLLNEAIAGNPDVLEWQVLLSQVETELVTLYVARGKYEGAHALAERTRDRLEALIRQAPKEHGWRANLALSLLQLAKVQSAQSRIAEARMNMQRAQTLLEELAQAYPQNQTYQEHVATVDQHVADLQWDQGEWREATSTLEHALHIYRQLAERDPTNIHHADAYASQLRDLGDLLFQQGRLVDANRVAEQSITAHLRMLENAPDTSYLDHFGLFWSQISACRIQGILREDAATACSRCEDAADTLQVIAEQQSRDTHYELASLHLAHQQAKCHHEANDPQHVLSVARAGTDVVNTILKQRPRDSQALRHGLALTWFAGQAAVRLGNLDDAQRWLDNSTHLRETLLSLPNQALDRVEETQLKALQARILHLRGEHRLAEAALHRTLEALAPTLERAPHHALNRLLNAQLHTWHAQALLAIHDPSGALNALDASRATLDSVFTADTHVGEVDILRGRIDLLQAQAHLDQDRSNDALNVALRARKRLANLAQQRRLGLGDLAFLNAKLARIKLNLSLAGVDTTAFEMLQ